MICLLLCWIGCLLELVELLSCLFWFVCCFTAWVFAWYLCSCVCLIGLVLRFLLVVNGGFTLVLRLCF